MAFLKRTFDIVGSLILIIISSPVMLFVAVGTKLSSPGPIFFKQERVGRYKEPFTMYKFRSMRVNATEKTGWSQDVDPRKTKFGSFIRKCSLDELPQFFNVLKGDMSLIGPRPEIPFHVSHFIDEIPLYLVRQQVRPGITGWAQVNGLRGDTSIEERVKYDIWYIENWSFSLDIKILFRTVFGGMINSEKIN
jgi:exopolysaccharide biosynthesis polyprenyl glycosylphosphotransferase